MTVRALSLPLRVLLQFRHIHAPLSGCAGPRRILPARGRAGEEIGNLGEIRDGLIDFYPCMDEGVFGERMQRALTAGELAGRVEVGAGEIRSAARWGL